MIEAVLWLSPLNSSDALHFDCIHFHVGSVWKSFNERQRFITDLLNPFKGFKKQAMQTNNDWNKACWFCRSWDLTQSWRLLSPGSLVVLTAVIHMTVLTWEQGLEVSCYRFPCPITQGPSLFGHALSSTSQPCNAFYLPSKQPLFLQVSHFKGPVEGCSNLLCACQREYVLNFAECTLSTMNQKQFRPNRKSVSRVGNPPRLLRYKSIMQVEPSESSCIY